MSGGLIGDMRVHPFANPIEWTGRLVSFDGTFVGWTFSPLDLDEVIVYAEQGDEWDGKVAGLARLRDGRFIGWETFYGPTGDGFCCDAYGGDADVIFSSTIESATAAFTDDGRRLLTLGDT